MEDKAKVTVGLLTGKFFSMNKLTLNCFNCIDLRAYLVQLVTGVLGELPKMSAVRE